jgi:hypothetical protein
MKTFASWACAAAALVSGVSAASYDDIPDIEVYGQHFFYTNNGSQLYVCANMEMDRFWTDSAAAT